MEMRWVGLALLCWSVRAQDEGSSDCALQTLQVRQVTRASLLYEAYHQASRISQNTAQ